MTDAADVLQSLAPAAISVLVVVGIALRTGRKQRKREEREP
jgi:Mg2+/citrate symporter